jgi:hypothetical protein
MKLSTLVVCLGTVAMGVANAATYRVTLFEKAVVAKTELKPGDYKLDLNGNDVRITMGNKMMVETTVKVETNGSKFAQTSVRYGNEGGKYQVQEIRLGGTNTLLIFNE